LKKVQILLQPPHYKTLNNHIKPLIHLYLTLRAAQFSSSCENLAQPAAV